MVNYCKSLKYDVLSVTELWWVQGRFQNKTKDFVVGEDKVGEDDEKKI